MKEKKKNTIGIVKEKRENMIKKKQNENEEKI